MCRYQQVTFCWWHCHCLDCMSLFPLSWHTCVHYHAHLTFALKSSLIAQIPVLWSVPITSFSSKEVSVDVLTALPQKWHHLKEEQWQMMSVKGEWESREIALLVKRLPPSTKTWLQLPVLTLKSGESKCARNPRTWEKAVPPGLASQPEELN